jgi:hypothetical protein
MFLWLGCMFFPYIFWCQQGEFIVQVNKDTFSRGEVVYIEFHLHNTDGKFMPPFFEDFIVVGGPNMKSSMSILNGEVSSKRSYSYVLQPAKEGEIVIGGARCISDDNAFETEPVKIFISEREYETQQNAIEKSYKIDSTDTSEKKKKRPLKRI